MNSSKIISQKKNNFENKNNNEKNSKLIGIICSSYICYYFRLNDFMIRNKFDSYLKIILFKLINEENSDNNEELKDLKQKKILYQEKKNQAILVILLELNRII